MGCDERGEAAVGYLFVIALALGLTVAVHASAVPFAFAIDRVHELVLSDVP